MGLNLDKSSGKGECGSNLQCHFTDKLQQTKARGHGVGFWGGGLRWLGIGCMAISTSGWAALSDYGQTTLQRNTGATVQSTCGNLAGTTTFADSPLFSTCNAMIQTSVELDGGMTNGRSLMLTADQLAGGLQQIATEEFAASGQLGTEVGSNRINIGINRLVEVRRGARGFNIAGRSPNSNTLLAKNSQWLDAYAGERGGAAGDVDVWDRLGVFISGNYSTGERDATSRTNAFDFDTYGTTLGMDYRFTENLILGVAITYNDVVSDFDKSSAVSGGGVDADGWGGFVYGTYFQDRFYIDALAGYAKSDYDIKRRVFITNNNSDIDDGLGEETALTGGNNIAGTAKASPDSDDYIASIGGGYHFGQGPLSYGPYGRLTYLKVEVDGYKEKGLSAFGLNLDVDGQDWKSVTSVLGGQISYASSETVGVVTPQARLAWVHEYEDDSTKMKATYIDPLSTTLVAITDDPDSDYFELGVGVSAVFKNGVQAFFNYDTVLGMDDFTIHMFSLGGRWEF